MGSYAVLSIDGYEIFNTKNSFDEWLFKLSDRRIENERYYYEITAATLERRLEFSGATLVKAQREFDRIIRKRLELIERYEGEVLDANEDLDEDSKALKTATLDSWLPKLAYIVKQKLEKTEEYEESEEYGCPILNILLRTPIYQQYDEDEFLPTINEVFPVNWPCENLESFARALVEILDQEAPVVLDITDLVDGGWASEFEDLEEHLADSTRIYEYFEEGIADIKALSLLDRSNETLLRLLYANVVTAMETYLGDTIRKQVLSKPALLRRFVETNSDLRDKKFPTSELFNVHDVIKETAADLLEKTVFHQLDRVIGMYKNVMQIEFPRDELGALANAVSTRHDIVHRNGKSSMGKVVKITPEALDSLVRIVRKTVKAIDIQVQDGLLDEIENDEDSPDTV